MRYQVLGGLRVDSDGHAVDLGGHKQRTALAALLLDANQVVPVSRLVDRIWEGTAPPRAVASVQAYIAHLRRALEPDRPPRAAPTVLLTEAGGYRVCVPRADLDATAFEDAVGDGRVKLRAGDAGGAVEVIDRALALWQPLLPELGDTPWVADAAARLGSLHAAALDTGFEARLVLGDGQTILSDLESAIRAHPFDERLRGHLALALYQAGRQTDALRALAEARRVLADEIGVEPGPELRSLEADILAQAPHLTRPATTGSSRADGGSPARALTPAAPNGAGGDGRHRRAAPGPLIGRAHEVAALADAVESALAGRGRPIVISGEAGIGKTRLMEELTAQADAAGMVVTWVSGHELSTGAAFWVGDQIGNQLLAGGYVTPDELEPVRRSRACAVATSRPVDPRCPAAERHQLHRQATELLRALEVPVLLAIDDLQWADAASLRLFEALAAELWSLPVILAATVRTPGPHPPDALSVTLGELARQSGAVRLDVRELSPEDVGEWLRRCGDDVPAEVVDLVYERTGGNPFVVGEVVDLLLREGRVGDLAAARAAGVPAAVHDVVRRNVATLPSDARETLTIASVLGNSFDVDLLAEVCGKDVGTVLELLDPAVDAGLIGPDADSPVELRFSHSLVAEALRTELGPTRRARLHAAAVRAIEVRRADDIEEYLAWLVQHALAGAAAGTAGAAFEYAARAARRATARLAYEDAATHWADALRALDLAGRTAPARRLDVLIELGLARRRCDDLEGSQEALVAATRLAEATGDTARLARAAVHLNQGTLWHATPYTVANPAAIAALERGLVAVGPEATVERAAILGALADALYYTTESDRAEKLTAEAVQLARRSGEPEALSRALSNRYRALWRPDRVAERRSVAEEHVALVAGTDVGPELSFVAHLGRAVVALEHGDRATRDADVDRARVLAEQSRSPGHLNELGWFEASMLLLEGRYAEAEAAARRTHELYRRTRGWGADAILASYAAAIAHDQGRHDEVLDHMSVHLDGSFGLAVREQLAWMLAESGDHEGARALVGPPGSIPDPPEDWLWLATTNAAADTRAALGDVEAAEVLADRLRPHAGRLHLVGAAAGAVVGPVDVTLARLAAVLGEDAAARRHIDAAVELLERFDARPWLARALVIRGELLADSDDPLDRAAAEQALERARALAHEVGLAPVLATLDRRAGAEVTAEASTGRDGLAPVAPRLRPA